MKQVVITTWSKLVWINPDSTNLHNAVDVLDVCLVVRGCIEQDVIIRSEQKRDSIFSLFEQKRDSMFSFLATEDILIVWCSKFASYPNILNILPSVTEYYLNTLNISPSVTELVMMLSASPRARFLVSGLGHLRKKIMIKNIMVIWYNVTWASLVHYNLFIISKKQYKPHWKFENNCRW